MANSIREGIIGAWTLISFEQEMPDGRKIYPLGTDAMGSIYYLSTGQVSVHIMQVSRTENVPPALYENRLLKYTDLGYLAYSGHYYLDKEERIMTHEICISIYPDWVGGQQVRAIRLVGDHLTLSSVGEVGPEGMRFHLLWKRE